MKPERLWWTGFSALAAALGLSSAWLPAPLPADAPSILFSATRALEHVKAMAQAPHPAGSTENRRVREYVLARMRELGLKPREIEARHGGVRLVNLYGELEGTQPTNPPILLVSHYDSTPNGPGAADDASGVATILETIRALRERGTLRNRLGVLITDGEELGSTGAEAFIRDQADLLKGVRLVVNLEARGNHGPVLMFETAPDNGQLMELFRQACPMPAAASFSQDIYRRMPNGTDFTAFIKADKRGFNFSFVGGLAYYHSPQDTPENLSLRTLQHYGSCVMPLTARLGQLDDQGLGRCYRPGDATFFTLWRGWLVSYPSSLAWPLALITAGLLAVGVGRGLWSATLRVGAIAASLGVGLLATVLAIGVGAAGVYGLVRLLHLPHSGPFVTGLRFEGAFVICLLLVAAAITLGLKALLLRWTNPCEELTGALAVWVALTVAATAILPGASYLFMWPAFFGGIALLFSDSGVRKRTPLYRALLTAVPAALLLAPTLFLLHQAITVGVAPVSTALTSLAVCLMPLGLHDQAEQTQIVGRFYRSAVRNRSDLTF
jgi:hypothetical protein